MSTHSWKDDEHIKLTPTEWRYIKDLSKAITHYIDKFGCGELTCGIIDQHDNVKMVIERHVNDKGNIT